MPTVSVRYIVDDVDAAIEFYCERLGFREEMHPAPSFAMLSRGDLRLVLSAPGGVVLSPSTTFSFNGLGQPSAGLTLNVGGHLLNVTGETGYVK